MYLYYVCLPGTCMKINIVLSNTNPLKKHSDHADNIFKASSADIIMYLPRSSR